MNPLALKFRTVSILWSFFLFPLVCVAQERKAFEGVVSWKKSTIGTVILLDLSGDSVSGWIRLEKFVPIEGGSVSETGIEFQAKGNTYRIDERRGRTYYSGPDGEGNRLVIPLTRMTGQLQELVEDRDFSGQAAIMEVNGRRWEFRYGTPALWKRQEEPFESFSRLEDLIGREVSVWASDADLRTGRIVVVEEPVEMNIPLKAPKK
jgi:hypothetical protein